MIRKNKDNGFIPGTILFSVLFLVFALTYSGNPGNHNKLPPEQPCLNTSDIAIIPAYNGLSISGNNAAPAHHKSDIRSSEISYKAADFERVVTRTLISLSVELFKMTPVIVWRQSFMLSSLHGDELPA